jgi:type I restriction enzyme S subunit
MNKAAWREVRLGDVATVHIGGTPSTLVREYWGDEIPWMNSGDLHQKVITDLEPRITERGLRASSAQLIDPPAVAVGLVGQGKTRGTAALVLQRLACSQSVALIKAHDRLDARYLFHNLDWRYEELRSTSGGGSGRGVLSKPLLEVIPLPVPPLEEQRRIARILDTLEEQIGHSERLVSKSFVVRNAMLMDLLTRSGFPVEPMEDLVAQGATPMRSGPFGSELLASELRSSGVPILGIDNVEEDRFIPRYSRFVDLAKFRELQRYTVNPRDIMVTIMGTVGRCCVVPDDIGLALSSKHVWTITLDQEKYRPWLASLQINYAPWVRQHFHRDSQGGIMSAIRSDTLRTLRLPVPPMEAQLKIENALRSQTELIAQEKDTLDKLRLLKKGLMKDLLTGKVRVTCSEELTD